MPRRVLLVILALLAFTPAGAFAKLKIDIETGWEEKFRPGRWTPLFLTLQDSSPRQVIVEVYCPTDRRYALEVAQALTVSPNPVTVPIYVPLTYKLDETTITIRDANSGRRIESVPISDFPAYAGRGGPQQVDAQSLFVLISGSGNTDRMLQGQFRHPTVEPVVVPMNRLPVTPEPYGSVDLVILNQPEFARLNPDQQSALADWVHAGGLLVINPGVTPAPAAGPLAEIMPARLGQTKQIEVDAAAIKKAGLPERFRKLTGRELLDIPADARPTPLFGPSGPIAVRRWVGMGQVLLLPVDVSSLMFDNSDRAGTFWNDTLRGVTKFALTIDPNNRGGGWFDMTDHPRRAFAIRQTLDWIGDVPGAGSFGFSYVAIVLIAMMFVVGPIDWFVLKWTNRQPWTWVTISGWIGLVTLGSIFVGHIFKSGDVHFRTASVIDEAVGGRVAAADLAGLYSPQTTEYEFQYSPYGWWRTAGVSNPYNGSNLLMQVPCHQDYRGNRPLSMLINVWNVRFIEGQEIGTGPAFVQTQLKATPKRVTGSITNRAPFALRDVMVRTGNGVAHVDGELAPGATIAVDAILHGDETLKAATTQMTDSDAWQLYYKETATTRPTAETLGGVADLRSVRIDQQLADRDDVACVYAAYDAPPDERLTLTSVKDAKRAHTGMVRAIVPLGK
jgi:hypothetical protein